MDAPDIYGRTLTSRDAAPTAMWYLDTTTFAAEPHPEIVVNHVEKMMLDGAEPQGEDAFRVPWEIGLFRDAITGQPATRPIDPPTGVAVDAPRIFEEGLSDFTIRRRGDDIR